VSALLHIGIGISLILLMVIWWMFFDMLISWAIVQWIRRITMPRCKKKFGPVYKEEDFNKWLKRYEDKY
jgi:hypothetical protein